MANSRKDSRGYVLKTGEFQRKDGRCTGSWRKWGWWYYSDKSSKDRINQGFLADLVLQKNAFGEVFTGGAAPFSTENMNLLH